MVDKNIYFIYVLLLFLLIQSFYYEPNYNVLTTKSEIYKYIPNKYLSLNKLITNKTDLLNIKYPIIIKPSDGYQGIDVHLLNNQKEALQFYNKNNIPNKYVIQKYHPGPYEVGLYYIRIPYKQNGYIFNLVLKKDPLLVKKQKWETLMCHKTNNCTRQINWITPQLTKVIDNISKRVPDFYIGRYDIRFENLNDFKNGKNFIILELNTTNASPSIRGLQNYTYSFSEIIKYKILRIYISILTRLIYFIM